MATSHQDTVAIEAGTHETSYLPVDGNNMSTRDKELRRESKRLDNEIEELKAEIAEMESYCNASKDARKMYGDVTPGDITHQDVTLEYTNHFKHAFRNMPREFRNEKKYQVWQMCRDIVQASFDLNKERIIGKMKEDLRNSLSLKQDKPGPLDESTRDLHRAFKMIIRDVNKQEIEEIEKKVLGKHSKSQHKEVFKLVMEMILKLDPADYKSFVTEGKLRDERRT